MNVFAALADPTRLQVFELIAQGEKSVSEIVQRFNFTAPTISQHLKVLRDAGLVVVRSEAQRRYYAVNQEGVETLQQWFEVTTRQWHKDLDTLERVLQEEKQRRKSS